MTFMPRFERPATFTRGVSRTGPAPRIADAEKVNQPSANPIVFSPPVGGLKLFNDASQVPDGGALVLNNWVCQADTVRIRGGSVQRNSGLPGEVFALMPYTSGAAQRCFSVSGSLTHQIHDVTNEGAVGAAAVTGLTPAIWSSTQFTTSGGTQFLVVCGMGNTRQIYDGAAWATTPAITGVVPSTLSQAWQHGGRLFFVQGGSTDIYYLAVDSIGGAATRFPLGGVLTKGGTAIAGATWTSDAGSSGLRSTCVIVSSEGEIVVYDGPDPTTWSLQGVYQIAKPCGINCFMKTGGDLAVMTEDGLYAMSQIISLDAAALSNQSVSKDIRPLWRLYAGTTNRARWAITRRDAEGYAIVSFPSSNGAGTVQFVANLQTGAWSTFAGWSPTAMALFNGALLFGTANGRVMFGDSGGQEDGASYSADYIGPYRQSQGGEIIVAKAMRAMVRSTDLINPKVTALFDYSTTVPIPPQSSPSSTTSKWNSGAKWDSGAKWGGVRRVLRAWQSVSGSGSAVAPCVQYTVGQIGMPTLELIRTDMQTETGEVVA